MQFSRILLGERETISKGMINFITNKRSTWGGAVTAFGLGLIGVGHLPSKDSSNIQILFWVELSGYICAALGAMITALMSADAKSLKGVAEQVSQNKVAIETTAKNLESGDTSHTRRDIANAQAQTSLNKP